MLCSVLITACNKSELDTSNNDQLELMFLKEDFQLETQIIDIQKDNIAEDDNTIDSRAAINENFKINRSRGSLSNFDFIKSLKWNIEFNAKTDKVSGSGSLKVVANDGEFDWDLVMEPLCTEVWGTNNNKAFNLFRVVQVNSIGTNAFWNEVWGNLDTAPFIIFNTKDGQNGNRDKISGFGFVDPLAVSSNLEFNNLDSGDRCHFLLNTIGLIPFADPGSNPTIAIPDNDWLIVKGVN